MACKDLINNFQANNHVILETGYIKNSLTSILSKTKNARVREAKIADFIKREYAKTAAAFEFNKARDTLMNVPDASITPSFKFFEEYVEIISEMVKETSDDLVAQAKDSRAKAEKALEDARKKYEDAQLKYQNDQNTDNKNEVDKASSALKNAEKKLNASVEFKPYKGNMDYFGIREGEVDKLLEDQINSAVYMNVRKAQIASVGVTSSVFMDDLKKAFEKKPTYENATAADRRRIHQVYATNKLMKAELDSKTGFWGWVWKTFTHRAEAKAMRNYIKAANEALASANFGEDDIQAAETDMTTKGCFYDRYQKSGTKEEIKEKFAQNELKYVSIKAERDKIATISQLPLADQFFEINFRPSADASTLINQITEFNKVSKVVTGKNNGAIPKDVLSVFKMTSKKMAQVKEVTIKAPVANPEEAAIWVCEEAEYELQEKGTHKNYQPMKFSDIVALTEQKPNVAVNLDSDNKDIHVAEPIKEEIIKNPAPVKE